MSLKKVESESFTKSFSLFFLSLTLLMSLILYSSYTSRIKEFDNKLYTQMRLCSFDLKCEQFTVDFIEADKKEIYKFYNSDEGPFALFSIPNNTNYVIQLLYPKQSYQKELQDIKKEYLYKYLFFLLLLASISALFSWYALRPLRQALVLSDEFIKDILHDFNTPLSSLRLNSSLLQKELPENKKLGRIERAVQTILSLQDNLRSYIDESPLQNESLDLKELLEKRSQFFSENYTDLSFELSLEPMTVHANTGAITRIIDNLISNAAKYNRKNGTVEIILNSKDDTLTIKDTGRGIKDTKKIFQRFYKEHERGLGIGLHIVKKLSDSLHIPIDVHSQLEIGSSFTLYLTKIRS